MSAQLQSQLQQDLTRLPDWTLNSAGAALVRRFEFADFRQAFAFMTEMAAVSETLNHHPEWFNVHRRVDVTLTTHDAVGLSALDIAWARAADASFTRRCGDAPTGA
jgi:4a-hydroxytetrahydrobiopterin dehydratase